MRNCIMYAAAKSQPIADIVARALRAVRSFGSGEKLAGDIQSLQNYLGKRGNGDILASTPDLEAVSLIFDYEDSRGIIFTERIKEIGELILRNRTTRIQEIFHKNDQDPASRLKWMRQVVWVILAYALWFHRHNRLDRMGSVLAAAKELLDNNLLPEADRPGTLSRWNYYKGLQLRDQGDLEWAMEHFVQSFHYAQERRKTKSEQLKARRADKEELDAEEAFTRACLARIQAFGFGEVAFFKGDLSASSAWFRTALMTLEGEGLKRWKLSVSAYLNGSQILLSPFTPEGEKKVSDAVQNLESLADELARLHPGYAGLARAFSNLGRVRLAQMRQIETNCDSECLQVESGEKIQVFPQASPSYGEDDVAGEAQPNRPHGAISALIALINAEVLLRCKRTEECEMEIRWIRKQLGSSPFAQVEADLLQAQLQMINNEWKRAARILEKDRNLDYRANRNQRALWLALASTVRLKLNDTLSARILAHRARSVENRVGDGFVRHFVQLAASRALPESTSILPMPYQAGPPNLSLKKNLDEAKRNVIQTALDLDGSIKSPEELAPVLRLGRTAIYDQIEKKLLDEFFKNGPSTKENPEE